MGNRIWVTGYRAYELSVFGTKDPKLAVIKDCLRTNMIAALDDGMEWLITGGEQGTEQWSAEVGLDLQKDYPDLKIAIMLPYANFGERWQENSQARLNDLRARVNYSASISKQPYQSGRQLAEYGTFMTEHTDGALLLYDTEFPGKTSFSYDRIKNLPPARHYQTTLISMYDLQDSAESYAERQNNDSQGD